MNSISRYGKIYYHIPHELGTSMLEYILLDMIHQLQQKKGWCYKSVKEIAKDMSLSVNGVQKMKARLLSKGLLTKNQYGQLRTTEAYNLVVRHLEANSSSRTTQLQSHTTQLYGNVQPSGTKIINEIKRDNTNNMVREDNRGLESESKERIREARRTRNWTLLKANA